MPIGADSINKIAKVSVPIIGFEFQANVGTGSWIPPQQPNSYSPTEVAGKGAYDITQKEGEVKIEVNLTPGVQRYIDKLNKVTTSYAITVTMVDGSKKYCFDCRAKEMTSATGKQTLAWFVPSYHG